ncbi:hypothetical protein L6452_28906 [Arctium lappa]|uniref:Uncharacterized protein n=1 Tax=Arctium lappa TaxID=4217 RepID=A0ACB9A433_ARCLA|nr:hypothetical protein L6452_28906 [Arctium lappa]
MKGMHELSIIKAANYSYNNVSINAIIDQQTCSSHNHQQAQDHRKGRLIEDIQAVDDHQLATSCNNNDSGDEDKSGQAIEKNEILPSSESDQVDQFWNMLDDIQLHDENGSQMEVDKWLRLLEEELGLIN